MFTNIHSIHYTEECKCIFLSDGDFIQCETCKCIQADCIDELPIDCPANSKRGE